MTQTSEATYGLFGRLTAQPGKRDALVGVLLAAANAMDPDSGCIHYVVGTGEGDDIWVWEAWTDKAAHDASLEPEEVREVIRQAMPLIASMGDQRDIVLAGGKGLPATTGRT